MHYQLKVFIYDECFTLLLMFVMHRPSKAAYLSYAKAITELFPRETMVSFLHLVVDDVTVSLNNLLADFDY